MPTENLLQTPAAQRQQENAAIAEAAPISAPVLFESIRRAGVEELQRPASALILSAFIAGVALGFSVLGKALFHRYLPTQDWTPLIENLGYSFGFLIVILGQMQLFTENTITPVCPLLADPNRRVFVRVLRLWGLVLCFNLLGAIVFGAALWQMETIQPETFAAAVAISEHALEPAPLHILLMGIGAGWLIAALVWTMPNAGSAKAFLIILVTWLISLAGFSHVIAGTCEAALLVFSGKVGLWAVTWGFTLPALVGNVIGGTLVFTVLMWGQIREEHTEKQPDFSYSRFWHD